MDKKLAERAISGDRAAFAELFESVSQELYSVAFIYLRNEEDARDAVQETAYRCCRGIKKLRSAEYFRSWAVRTAINSSLDILRKRRKTVPLDDISLSDGSSSPEEAAEAKELLGLIMDRLNEREKKTVLLRHLCGLSLGEIAKAEKMPLSTVKSTLYRAVEKLKKGDLS